jgi:hypothetical protein
MLPLVTPDNKYCNARLPFSIASPSGQKAPVGFPPGPGGTIFLPKPSRYFL